MNATNGTSWLSPAPVDECNTDHGNRPAGDFWIGVVSSIFGSITLNLGLNIQKLAFVRLARLPAEMRVKIYCYPLWVFGFAIFVLGNVGDAVGLTFTPQSVITPLGSISLVSNLIFAWLLVGENLDRATIFATIAIVIGVVAIVASGNQACTSFSLEKLMGRFRGAGFLAFTALHIGTLICLIIYGCKKEKKMGDAGISKLTDQERRTTRLVFPVAGSFFAAWTVLFTKSIGELLKRSTRTGSSDFSRPEAWLFMVAVGISAPLQIMYIQKGLAYFEAMYVIPIFTSTWTFSSIAFGGVFWGDFDNFAAWQFVVFFFGVGFIVLGILLLQRRGTERASRVRPDSSTEEKAWDKNMSGQQHKSPDSAMEKIDNAANENDKHKCELVRPVSHAGSVRHSRTSPVLAHIFANLHPPRHPLTGRERQHQRSNGEEKVLDGVIPLDEDDLQVERVSELDMSTNTAVRHIVKHNASFITLTAGALATTKIGAGSAMLAQASRNVKRLNSR
eukprot:g4946.t1